jgi:hypothetical protein
MGRWGKNLGGDSLPRHSGVESPPRKKEETHTFPNLGLPGLCGDSVAQTQSAVCPESRASSRASPPIGGDSGIPQALQLRPLPSAEHHLQPLRPGPEVLPRLRPGGTLALGSRGCRALSARSSRSTQSRPPPGALPRAAARESDSSGWPMGGRRERKRAVDCCCRGDDRGGDSGGARW